MTSVAPENLITTMRGRPALIGEFQMTTDPAVIDIDEMPRAGIASWLERRQQARGFQDRDVGDLVDWPDRHDVDEILARTGMLHGVQPSAVSALTKQLQPVDFPRGHTVFSEGEPGDSLYIVLTGKFSSAGGRGRPAESLAIMGPSDMFGELSLFDPGPRTATATAVTDVAPARWNALRCALVQRPAGDRRAAAAGARPQAAPDQRLAGRPDLHRRARPGGEEPAALARLSAPGRAVSCGSPTT